LSLFTEVGERAHGKVCFIQQRTDDKHWRGNFKSKTLQKQNGLEFIKNVTRRQNLGHKEREH